VAIPRTFLKNTLYLTSGSSFATLLGIVSLPIVTRLFGPEAYGVFAMFSAMVAIVSVMACMRYELSILLPDTDAEAATQCLLSILFAALVSLMLFILIVAFGDWLIALLELHRIGPYLYLIPVYVLFHGLFLAASGWKTRQKRFGQLAMVRVGNQSVTTFGSLSAGFSGATTAGALIWSLLAGKLVSTAVLVAQVWRASGRLIVSRFEVRTLTDGMLRYKKFPLLGSWSVLLSVSAWQLPVVLFGFFFSPMVAGLYALGFRILQLPMNLIGNSIGQVFFQAAAEAEKQDSLDELVVSLLDQVLKAILIPVLFLSVLGEDFYTIVFGKEWSQAGVYAQILCAWAFFWFLSAPFVSLFAVLERQGLQLGWNIVNATVRLGVICLGGFLQDIIFTVTLLSLSGAIIYGYKVLIILRLAQVKFARFWGLLRDRLTQCSIAFFAVLSIVWACDGAVVRLGFSAVILCVHFALIYREQLVDAKKYVEKRLASRH
tara:strand:- start:2230 stop:3693 length:1464 start_codon:yes stop_codon:yes gene_type:complete